MVWYGGSNAFETGAFAGGRRLAFKLANLNAVATGRFRKDGRQKDKKL